MTIRVGVTGVGGGVGQSIIKAVKMSTLNAKIVPIDITWDSAGFGFDGVKKGVVLPNLKGLDSPPEEWCRYIYNGNLDCLIPGSDHELRALSNIADEWGAFGCKVLVSNYDLVLKCEDKRITAQALANEEINCPVTYSPPPWYPEDYPVVIKPRIGSGSVGVVKAHTKEEVLSEFKDGYMVQEYLHGPEYTCSVFVDKHGEVIGTFQLKRELNNGATYRGEVVFYRDIHKLLVKIGKAFKPKGMLNVQLRMTDRGPVPFELNCRCSGTTAIRAHFGYNEPEMLIRHYVLGESLKIPKIKTGKVFRYWNEVYKEE